MKRILIASALALAAGGQALAADLPPPAPRAPATYIPVAPPYNWTGFYIGGNLGYGFGSGSFSDTAVPASNFTTTSNNGFLGGGQLGVNYEFWGGVVVGAEAMFDWAPNNGNTFTGTNGGTIATATINNRWLTTATGKLGYAWDRVMLYGKGGGAWVGQSNSNVTIGGVPFATTNSSNNLGWTAGVGIEWAFWGTWSARAEYDFVSLNNQTFTVPVNAAAGPFSGDVISSRNRFLNLITAGVNYKFGPW
jgi:outer membrane immunogenic protein